MIKAYQIFSFVFAAILAVGALVAAALIGVLPAFSVLALALALALFAAAGAALVYGLWLRARKTAAESDLIRASAYAERRRADLIHADNAAVRINDTQIIQITPTEFGYGVKSNLKSISWSTPAPALPAEVEKPVEDNSNDIPTAPTMSELISTGYRPKIDDLILGFTRNGPERGAVEDLLSTAVAGRPKIGKTTLLRFIAANLMLVGGRFVVLDPHGSLEDGAKTSADWIASTSGELEDGAMWIIDELNTRISEYRSGRRDFPPLMVIADEWPVIAESSPLAIKAARKVILEARKTNYYGMICGQGLPAEHFGGGLARNALSSRYIFKTAAATARQAGLDKDNARQVESLPRGVAIFEGPINPVKIAIPNTTAADLARIVEMVRRPAPAPAPEVDQRQRRSAPQSPPVGDVVTGEYRVLPDQFSTSADWIKSEQRKAEYKLLWKVWNNVCCSGESPTVRRLAEEMRKVTGANYSTGKVQSLLSEMRGAGYSV